MVGNTQRPVPWQGPNPNQARPHPQNPPARQIDNKARRRWTIAIIVAGVILVALVIVLVMM